MSMVRPIWSISFLRNTFLEHPPPHLDGYFKSEHAAFQLIALPNGHTRLVGTSWYRNRVFPVAYWRLWSDKIIHEIHMAVFDSIKASAEADAAKAAG